LNMVRVGAIPKEALASISGATQPESPAPSAPKP
jgi:hypothetical protein